MRAVFGNIIVACDIFMAHGGYGEAVNAPDCGSGTRGFDPLYPPHDSLAQSVEHLTFNQGVRGSNPRWITSLIRSNSCGFFQVCGYGGTGRRTRLRI